MRPLYLVIAMAVVWSFAVAAQQPASDGPQYASGNTLVKPANYREWTFLGSGLGMTYDASAAGTTFTNVFVNPAAYRGFMSTGTNRCSSSNSERRRPMRRRTPTAAFKRVSSASKPR